MVLIIAILLFLSQNKADSSQSPATVYESARFSVADTAVALSAKSFLVFDVATGQTLLSKQADLVVPIASITKLLTAAALLDSSSLEEKVVVQAIDLEAEGDAGKLKLGEKYSYRELLFPLLLESSNDAAAVFERVTKGEVVQKMNELSLLAGAKNTKLTDASGLSVGNISTVSDLALITSYLYKTQPHVFDITRLSQFVGPYTGWVNNNPILDKNYQGGKHGYTKVSAKTVVALFDEKFGVESRVIGYVILGSDDLRSDTDALRKFVGQSVKFE